MEPLSRTTPKAVGSMVSQPGLQEWAWAVARMTPQQPDTRGLQGETQGLLQAPDPGLGPLSAGRNPSPLQAIQPDSPVAFTHGPAGLTPLGRPRGWLASSEPLLRPFPWPCGHRGAET